MKKTGFALLAGLFILSIAAGGWAAEPPSWASANMVQETATVQAVDQSTRMVTLKGPKGNCSRSRRGMKSRTWRR